LATTKPNGWLSHPKKIFCIYILNSILKTGLVGFRFIFYFVYFYSSYYKKKKKERHGILMAGDNFFKILPSFFFFLIEILPSFDYQANRENLVLQERRV
jgi:hypothetical protein